MIGLKLESQTHSQSRSNTLMQRLSIGAVATGIVVFLLAGASENNEDYDCSQFAETGSVFLSLRKQHVSRGRQLNPREGPSGDLARRRLFSQATYSQGVLFSSDCNNLNTYIHFVYLRWPLEVLNIGRYTSHRELNSEIEASRLKKGSSY